MSNTFAQVNNAAHQGAFGKNDIPEPSLKQIAAGNYKKGSFNLHGLNIAIENPAFTYRRGTDKSGQSWSCLMQAAYGYIKGTTGADGDAIDCFVGHVPEQQTAYIINQKGQGGYFDEHKVMLGFLSQQQAVDTYNHCFERGWTGLMSVVPCTIEQLKWWLANGDKSRPVKPNNLPYAGLERMDSVVWGGTDGANLYSHNGHLHQLMYQIRQSDTLGHALEPMRYRDMVEELGNDGFVYESYDALIVEYNKLERKAKQLLMVMQGAADTVKPVGVTVSKPLTKNGVANVIAWFEMDDGQAVGVFFHNPDKNPKKLDAQDEMISYKWVLNKKDITIAVAPENGKDIIIRTVAKRIMQLVEKNHDRFAKANSSKAELNVKEQDLNAQVIAKQSQLDMLNKDIELLEAKKAEKEAQPSGEQLLNTGYDGIKAELKGMAWVDDPIVQGGLVKPFIDAQESGDTNPDGVLSISINRNGVNIAAKVGADTIIPNSVEFIPQYGIDAQSTQNYKKVADKINSAVEAYVAKQREAVKPAKTATLASFSSIMLGGTSLSDLLKADVDNIWSQSPLHEKAKQDIVDAGNTAIKVISSKDINDFASYATTFAKTNEALVAAVDPYVMVSPIIYRRKIKVPKYMVTGDDPKHYIENLQTDFEDFRISVIDKGDGAHVKVEYKDNYGHWWNMKNNAMESSVFEPITSKAIEIFNQYKASKTDIFATQSAPVAALPTVEQEPQGFFDDPQKKIGDEDKFTRPVNSTIILELPITDYRPEKMRVVKREFDNGTTFDVEFFSESMVKWIDQKSYTTEEKAIADAKGWYPEPTTDRPSNWRTNLANARAVAKSLGIETKGKKLELLVGDIERATPPDWVSKVTIGELEKYMKNTLGRRWNFSDTRTRKEDLESVTPMPPSYVPVVGDAVNIIDYKDDFIDTGVVENIEFDNDSPYLSYRMTLLTPTGLSKRLPFDMYKIVKVSEPNLSPSDIGHSLIKSFSELARKAGADNVVAGSAQGYATAYFFDGSTKKTSVVELDVSANVLPPSGEVWAFERHSKIEISDGKNNVIATFSPSEENILKAFDVANEYISKQDSQPEGESTMINTDKDYLQSIIDGTADLSNLDDVEARLTDISERLDADLEPLFEQAAEAFTQYGIAQAATV